jgi:hypothetical protein
MNVLDVPLVPHDGQHRLGVPVERAGVDPVLADALAGRVEPASATDGLQLARSTLLWAIGPLLRWGLGDQVCAHVGAERAEPGRLVRVEPLVEEPGRLEGT